MPKSRSWTFPVYPSPAEGVAPASSAVRQPSVVLVSVCPASLHTVGEEGVAPREEDSDAEWKDAVHEVDAAASEVQNIVLEVQDIV